MDEIMKHLETAYDKLSQITVSGENVDRMAMAKQELRIAFRMLDEIPKEVKTDGQND